MFLALKRDNENAKHFLLDILNLLPKDRNDLFAIKPTLQLKITVYLKRCKSVVFNPSTSFSF